MKLTGAMRAVMLTLIGLAASATAKAEVDDPNRMVDRVYFSVFGGVGQVTARHLSGPGGADARGVLSGPAWAGGFGVGIWPVDFIGIDLGFEALDLSFGELDASRCVAAAPCTGQRFGGFGLRLSPSLRLALPLRYVAPYVGAGPALLVPFFSTGELHGSPGPRFNFRYFAGSNIYLNAEAGCCRDRPRGAGGDPGGGAGLREGPHGARSLSLCARSDLSPGAGLRSGHRVHGRAARRVVHP